MNHEKGIFWRGEWNQSHGINHITYEWEGRGEYSLIHLALPYIISNTNADNEKYIYITVSTAYIVCIEVQDPSLHSRVMHKNTHTQHTFSNVL